MAISLRLLVIKVFHYGLPAATAAKLRFNTQLATANARWRLPRQPLLTVSLICRLNVDINVY